MNAPDPVLVEIDLMCRGLRIDPSCRLEDEARAFSRTRAGLGSGLEMVIPGRRKDLWLNAPVEEPFAARSPWVLHRRGGAYVLVDERDGGEVAVRIPPEPAWYSRETTSGIPMDRVGVLQGTYLGVYVGETCAFWNSSPSLACRFCTTGLNVGREEEALKSVDDVVETALAAKEESGVTFVHLNSGFQGERDIDLAAEFVTALKERVGVLVGVQMTPSKHLEKYDRLRDLGVDHLSFCFEFRNPHVFRELLPGKEKVFGREAFYRAMEYTSRLLGPGRVSGEIIAGVEPVEDTLRAIDEIVAMGAFPTVCIFRPTLGSAMADFPPPKPEEMEIVFRHLATACRDAGLPVGIAPNIEVSLVVQPDDTLGLLPAGDPRTWLYRAKLRAMKAAAGPWIRKAMARREPSGAPPVPAS